VTVSASSLVNTRLAILEGEISLLEAQATREEIDFQKERAEAQERFSVWDRKNKQRRAKLLSLIQEREALRNV
jgi:hypothetical protein